MKSFTAKPGEVEKKWVLIDASNQSLGRIASKAASIIRGKTKPTYTPHVDTGDNVIIINAAEVRLTGKKWDDKIYYRHTGYMGGIKNRSAKQIVEKQPKELLEKAINGMLPKTRLGRELRKNYRIYNNDQHPHGGQNPQTVTV